MSIQIPQRIKLNDHEIVYERTNTDSAADTMDGTRLRDVVKGAMLGDFVSDVANARGDGPDTGRVEIGMMDDDEAEEARNYFGVL